VQKGSKERRAQSECDKPAFEHIRDEDDGRRLVESMLFLKDKRAVHLQGQRWERRKEKQYEDECYRLERL
jgi:hypothetical protein